MAVPTHDQRDYDFAKAFNIPMVQVIEEMWKNVQWKKMSILKRIVG